MLSFYIDVTSNLYDKPTILTKEFSFSERAELYAHLLHWGEMIKRHAKFSNYKYEFMVHFCVENKEWEKYEEEFKKREYYQLPKFKEYWEEAKKIKQDEYDEPKGPERSPFVEEDKG